jgi:drug/metabolite transporter (DMT)-like permease
MKANLQKGKPLVIGYISAIMAALLFGSVSTIAKPILSNMSPLLLSSLVYIICGLALTPVAQRIKHSIRMKEYIFLVITSISGAVIAPIMFFFGLKQTTAIDSSLLSNGEIIFSIFLAITIFKEKLDRIGYIAITLVLVGIVIVTTNLQFDSSLLKINEGNLLIIGATLFWGLDNNISRMLSHKIDITKIIQLKSFIGATILIALAYLLGVSLSINLIQTPYILFLGIIGFGISLYFFLHSLKRIGTINTMLIFSLSSVFGLILASIFLHEHITAFQVIAVGIMLSGIYLVSRKNNYDGRRMNIKSTRN